MKHTICLRGRKVAYVWRRSKKARKIRLQVSCNTGLTVIVPERVSIFAARNFMREKASWIIRTVDFFSKKFVLEGAKPTCPDYDSVKVQALEFLKWRIDYYNKVYGFRYNRVSVKNHKARWGSCSLKRNLNFNYRIMFLPNRLSSYIIVHELCHLREMNHSPRFWALVAKSVPDYKARIRELKKVIVGIQPSLPGGSPILHLILY